MNNSLSQLLYIFQLEDYDTKRFLRWTKTYKLADIKENKKKLKWTTKAKIVYLLAKLLNLIGINPATALTLATKFLFFPELIVKNTIVMLARIKLKFYPKLQVIGITGSYGKTSVKEILYQVLSSRYQVLRTPENFNTPLGIARVILRDLKKEHEVFIVEMGAYQKGDIKKLCNIVNPRIGILTAIGKQHLERFGSVENISSTKKELLLSLPADGIAVINGDNDYCRDIAKTLKIKTILYSLRKEIKLSTINHQLSTIITAENISINNTRSSFQIKNSGEVRTFKTGLLGTHNVLNILPAIIIARKLDISWEKIVDAVSTLLPLPHRLQPISGANDTLIIDDSYNANPSSVRAALTVLKEIDSPRKIVITPGLVELGKEQEKENELFGEEIAVVADYLIVVGNTNKEALGNGFLRKSQIRHSGDPAKPETPESDSGQARMTKDNSGLFLASTLNEATQKLQQIVIPKSVILFENDLPDQYL